MRKELFLTTLGLWGAGQILAGDLTRAELDKLLQDLAKKPEPTKLAPGAMCYDMAMPPDRAEYVCPTCRTKTLHTNESARIIGWHLQSCKEAAKEIQRLGVPAHINEQSFCSSCNKTNEAIGIYLDVKQNGKVIHTRIGQADLPKLIAFLQKKLVWNAGPGGERPLKPELPRIRQLLGLEEPAAKQK